MRGSYQDAQKELTRLLGEVDNGTLPEPTKQTVAQYVHAWLDASEGKRSPKTLERYGELAENQIIPHIGDHLLQKLRPEHVEGWHATLLTNGLAPGTVFSAHRSLALYPVSSRQEQRRRSQCATDNVDPPKVEATEIEILSASEQLQPCWTHSDDHTLYPIVSLSARDWHETRRAIGFAMGRCRS